MNSFDYNVVVKDRYNARGHIGYQVDCISNCDFYLVKQDFFSSHTDATDFARKMVESLSADKKWTAQLVVLLGNPNMYHFR